jgi:curved DNA-binding protein CbpA
MNRREGDHRDAGGGERLTQRDAYEVLHVTFDAPQVVIQAAYRALASLYHPDSDPSPGAARRMAEVNGAYAKVRTADRRELYDRSRMLAARATQSAAPAAPSTTIVHRDPATPKRSVLDFGRYEGWSIGELAQRDPDYLRWLARHSSGLRFRREIEALLGAATGATPMQAKRR